MTSSVLTFTHPVLSVSRLTLARQTRDWQCLTLMIDTHSSDSENVAQSTESRHLLQCLVFQLVLRRDQND